MASVLATAAVARAGPNLMAIGDFGDVPYRRAEGRDSLSGKEVIFEFNEPAFDFGRVIVRSNQPHSVVRRDLFVGFTGSALSIGTQGEDRTRAVQVSEVEVWLRIGGRLEPSQSYEWELEVTGDEEIRGGIPALAPMFWADGEQIAAEINIHDPTPPDDGRIQRMLIPHGVVTLPDFRRQTGAAWVVLKPTGFGSEFGLLRFAFRRVEKDLAADPRSGMPIPVRYIPIRSVLEDKIALALDRGAAALESRRTPEFFWDGGDDEADLRTTAAAIGALGELGRSRDTLRPSLDWLANRKPADASRWSVRTLAGRLSCLARHAGLSPYSSVVYADILALVDAQTKDGGWQDGPVTAPGEAGANARPDHAATFEVLRALREARFAGAEVDQRVWRGLLQYWTDAQAYDGGFREKLDRYGGVAQATTTTWTAAGTAALISSLDMASGLGGRRCSAYLSSRTQLRAIASGMQWLDANYREEFANIGAWTRDAGAMDAIDEASYFITLGAVSGVGQFHEKNHFEHSAEEILRHYDEATGMFGVRAGDEEWAVAPSVGQTATLLEALGRGAAPAICQRIVVGDDEQGWGQYSGDAQHLTRYLAERRGTQFNWRRMDIDRPVRELAKTPILLLKVVGAFDWSDEQWKKVRAYCLAGGSVLIDVTEDDPKLRDLVTSGLSRAFPEWPLKDLPDDHVLYGAPDKLTERPSVRAIGNGFRDFVFLPAQSWSCQFHLFATQAHPGAFAFMNNLLTYVTDETPLRNAFVSSTYASPAVAARTMAAAHLESGGSVAAYPNLIETMDRLMQANYRLGVDEASDPTRADVLWVSVTGEAAAEDAVRDKLRSAITSGTMVFIDVVAGSSDWDENFRARLKSLSRGITLEELDRSDPVFTGEIAGTRGFNVVQVELRKPLQTRFSTRGRCALYRIRYNGDVAGVYSAYDIASGIGYHYFPGCRGVMPDDARKIAMNVFLTAYGRTMPQRTGEQPRADGGS